MSWTAVRPVSPVNHHDLMSCVAHIPACVGVVAVGVVAAIVGVGAVVARRDVVSAIVAVVVRVVVVRANGGCCGRHGVWFWRCIYVVFFMVVFDCQIVSSFECWDDEGLDLGKRRTDLRPSEDLLGFLSFLSVTSHTYSGRRLTILGVIRRIW